MYWRKVTDKLPIGLETVLVHTTDDEYHLGVYHKDWTLVGMNGKQATVDAWMHIPAYNKPDAEEIKHEALRLTSEAEKFIDSLKRRDQYRLRVVQRFAEMKGNRRDFVLKCKKKYASDSYKDRWYKRGMEPPEELIWCYYDYARSYGKEMDYDCSKNMFTTEMIYIPEDNLLIERMDGQGSILNVWEPDDFSINDNFVTLKYDDDYVISKINNKT